MGSWATKAAGIAMILLTSAAATFPDSAFGRWAGYIIFVVSGIGHILARQENMTSEDVGAKTKEKQ